MTSQRPTGQGKSLWGAQIHRPMPNTSTKIKSEERPNWSLLRLKHCVIIWKQRNGPLIPSTLSEEEISIYSRTLCQKFNFCSKIEFWRNLANHLILNFCAKIQKYSWILDSKMYQILELLGQKSRFWPKIA